MAAPAIYTQGMTFEIDDVGGSTPTAINGVKSVSGVGGSTAAEIDVTTLLSTAKEFRMGLQDFGSFTLNFLWNEDDAGQTEMLDKMNGQTPAKLVITMPATNPSVTLNVWTMTVYILKMEWSADADNVVMGTSTIRITGLPVRS